MNKARYAMFCAVTMLKERLQPIAQAGPERTSRDSERDLLWMRYADLVNLGYSEETSMIFANAPVSLNAVTSLLLPDLR